MEDSFKIIAVTSPEEIADEGARITQLLDGGIDYVHIRKPGWSTNEVRRLIESIDMRHHGRLRLHGHFILLDEFNLAGVQLNKRCDKAPRNALSMTRSCHSTEEIETAGDMDYVTLSPIYDSISKKGYTGISGSVELSEKIKDRRVVALGGITPSRFRELKTIGFMGAAMLGWIWDDPSEKAIAAKLRQIKLYRNDNFRLQFITDAPDKSETVRQIKEVIDGGGKWIQVRMKDADDSEISEVVDIVRPLCRLNGVTLIIDDRVELAAHLDVDGVHIGKDDMPPSEAREILGPRAIIGATANTFGDISRLSTGNVDYLGVGPFRFTTTKKRLAPVLGTDGYRSIRSQMNEKKITLPMVAIGGITLNDTDLLMSTGIDGIAVSGAIGRSGDPVSATARFLKSINK